MKKYSVILNLFMFLFTVFGLGFSRFTLVSDKEFYYDELTQPGSLSSYVTLDYNDQTVPDFRYALPADGKLSRISDYLPNTEGTDHDFVGWSMTKSGFYEDGTSAIVDPAAKKFVGGERLYAKYVNNGNYYQFPDRVVSKLEIAPDNNSIQKKVYLSPTRDSIVDQMVISEETQIYYNTGKTPYNPEGTGTDKTVKRPSEASVLLVLDCDVIIEGATFQMNSVSCFEGGILCNSISGEFTAVDLNGYNIFIRDTKTSNTASAEGRLLAYGLVYNSKSTGGIIVENGELRSIFTPVDFKGGGFTTNSLKNGLMVFADFVVPWLAVETVFSSDAVFTGDCSLFASSSKHSCDATLIGPEKAVLKITDGYIIRRTTSYLDLIERANTRAKENSFVSLLDYKYREVFILTDTLKGHLNSIRGVDYLYDYDRAKIEVSNFTIKVIGTEISFIYSDFPISSFYDVYVFNCDFSFAMPLVFMPGSFTYIDENSNINFKSQKGTATQAKYDIFARVTVLDSYPSEDFKYIKGLATQIGLDAAQLENMQPGKIEMNGRFFFDNIGTPTDRYSYYNIGGNIKLSEQALRSLQANSNKVYLNNYWAYFGFISHTSSLVRYGNVPLRVFNQPVISGEYAYFQQGFLGPVVRSKKVCEGLYQMDNRYYVFMYENNNTINTVNGQGFGAPKEAQMKAKYENLYGEFVPVDKVTWIDREKEIFFVTYKGNDYIYVAGLYVNIGSNTQIESGFVPSFAPSNVSKLEINSSNVGSLGPRNYDLSYQYFTKRWSVKVSI